MDWHYDNLRTKTVPGLLIERMKESPNEVAHRAKKLGIYKERTWLEFGQKVASCAIGFKDLGLRRGERVAIMGDPCEEYAVCELAGQALGAVTYGVYPTCSKRELEYIMEDGQASIFVAENLEYLDLILPLSNRLTNLRHIVVIDERGMFMYHHPSLSSYKKVIENGENQLRKNPGLFEEIVRQIKPSDSLSIIYTSGTSGNPKGALISHEKHLAGAYTLINSYPILDEIPHRTVVCLPMCHYLGKVTAITLPLLTRIVPHYAEGIDKIGLAIFETAPTILFMAPRYFKRLSEIIFVGIENSSPLKKLIYQTALKIGRRHLKNVWDGRRDLLTTLSYFLCAWIAFKPIISKIGFKKLQLVVSGGAPFSNEIMTLWQIYGISISETYAQSETGGAVISSQGQSFPRPGDVGQPASQWEIKLARDGEILVRGKGTFECYWNNPKLTNETLDEQGWLHTGDIGQWTREGKLEIIGRKQDIIVTSNGKMVSAMKIEKALKSSIYIGEAVVFGDNREYISALIEINFDSVSNWARRNNIPHTDFSSLANHPAIIKFLGTEIDLANSNLSPFERVQKFQILASELDPREEEELITPTRNIKRECVSIRFEHLVELMYKRNKLDSNTMRHSI